MFLQMVCEIIPRFLIDLYSVYDGSDVLDAQVDKARDRDDETSSSNSSVGHLGSCSVEPAKHQTGLTDTSNDSLESLFRIHRLDSTLEVQQLDCRSRPRYP